METNLKPGTTITFPYEKLHKNQIPIEGIVDENGCLICTSHKTRDGKYPRAMRGRKDWLLNRYVFHFFCEEIPEGEIIRHKCDNPKCINPEHLERGTIADNNRDKLIRGRQYSKLTLEQVYYIKFIANETVNELSEKYNVSCATINGILNNKSWKWVKEDIKKLA